MDIMIQFNKAPHFLIVIGLLLLTACSTKPAPNPLAATNNSNISKMYRAYVSTRSGQVHYRAFAPSRTDITAPALVALHLAPNSGQVFSTFLPKIGRDRIAIAPDYPGFGMSDAISGPQRIEAYAASMLDLIDNLALPTPVDLLGYHTGAGVALEMARQRPDTIGRLLLMAVPVLTEQEREAGAALPPIPFDTNGEFAKKEWQSSWRWKGPGQDEASVFATFAEKMRPGARDRRAEAILSYDLTSVLTATKHEMMIVRVNDDLWIPSQRAHQLVPSAKYVELPQFGHGVFHAAPEAMDTLAREFLTSNTE